MCISSGAEPCGVVGTVSAAGRGGRSSGGGAASSSVVGTVSAAVVLLLAYIAFDVKRREDARATDPKHRAQMRHEREGKYA